MAGDDVKVVSTRATYTFDMKRAICHQLSLSMTIFFNNKNF